MNFDFFKRGSSVERKPLTEAQKQWRKKYLIVFPALFISFLGCLWLIFGGALSEDSTDTGKANMELPDGSSDGIEGNKTKLMEAQAAQDAKQRQNVNISLFDSANGQSSDLNLAVQPDTIAPDNQAIQASATTYQEVQASLDDFFIPENTEASQMADLQARIDELEAQNAMAQQPQQPDQMEMLERSYQLAAQYMGNGNGGNYQAPQQQDDETGKRNVQPVAQVSRNVVSSLGSSSNRSFNTSVGTKSVTARNTIAAVVAGNQSVIDGESVKLRTTEPMWIGNRLIPRNTTITGSGRVQGERLEIEITSIECEGSIYDVELQVFDSDGQEGINIPQSMESDALHEIGANMGSTMGSSINISTNTGAQIASDVGRGLINGVSQYLTKKMRTVKVHLKAGYRVMLHQPEDQ